jgi:hypothetical protein
MVWIRPCLRCGVGVSGHKRFCSPCADERRTETKARYNAGRPKAPAVAGERYVGTKVGMMRVRTNKRGSVVIPRRGGQG